LSFVRKLVDQGRFRPVIDRRYALSAIGEAYAYAASGQKTGSVVLTLA
jgi:NADPH:quinone reductase-like Zn-dependent oxidoreductase